MFGMSGTELAIILILALLLLGPDKLPGLARTAGKAVRDFKKATNDLRGTVETEFYKMDQPDEPEARQVPASAPARAQSSDPYAADDTAPERLGPARAAPAGTVPAAPMGPVQAEAQARAEAAKSEQDKPVDGAAASAPRTEPKG